jgi:hypothetical protein
MSENKFLLKTILPELCIELKELLKRRNIPGLTETVDSLMVFEKCVCGENACASIYTAPKPVESFGDGHENIMLDAECGMLILDVVNSEIRFIEILDRPEYKKVIDKI